MPPSPTTRAASRCGAGLALPMLAAATALLALGTGARAQQPLIRARVLAANAPVKIFFPTGSIRVDAWDRDSIEVRGRVARGEHFYLAGDAHGIKLGILDHPDGILVRPSDIVLRVPRASQISVKSVSATITATGVSGWFYSVSGAIHLSGRARTVEVESLAGDVDLGVIASWVRARTGDGRLVVRGAPEDLDAATVRGPLDVESAGVVRGRFASVQGDIRFAGAPAANGVFEFSNHSGAVNLVLPRTVSATLDLSSITGSIENNFTQLRPVASAPAGGATLHLQLGAGGPHVTVRTFRGLIRVGSR